MAQTLIRLAAGVGAVVAITVAGGAGAAVTSADPGGPRSPSSHSGNGGQSRGDGNGQRGQAPRSRAADRHGGDRGNDRRAGDGRGAQRRAEARGAAGGRADDDLTTVVVGRPSSAVRDPEPQTATTSRVAALQPAASEAVEPANPSATVAGPAVRVAPGGGGGGGGGSTGQAPAPFVAPKTSVGNGRTPAFISAGPEELPNRDVPAPVTVRPVAAPAVAFVPPPPPAPSPSRRPVQPFEWSLAPTPVTESPWGRTESGWPAGVLFGLAGMLLAPIAGVWVGYRHAGASKAAAHLIDH